MASVGTIIDYKPTGPWDERRLLLGPLDGDTVHVRSPDLGSVIRGCLKEAPYDPAPYNHLGKLVEIDERRVARTKALRGVKIPRRYVGQVVVIEMGLSCQLTPLSHYLDDPSCSLAFVTNQALTPAQRRQMGDFSLTYLGRAYSIPKLLAHSLDLIFGSGTGSRVASWMGPDKLICSSFAALIDAYVGLIYKDWGAAMRFWEQVGKDFLPPDLAPAGATPDHSWDHYRWTGVDFEPRPENPWWVHRVKGFMPDLRPPVAQIG